MTGSGETCAGAESLIRLIDDKSVSRAEAYDRWDLTPLNIRSADIPVVCVPHPIRIDCSTSRLLVGQVTAVSSSCLILMMPCIDPLTAVCCAEERVWKSLFVLYLIIHWSLIQYQFTHCKESVTLNDVISYLPKVAVVQLRNVMLKALWKPQLKSCHSYNSYPVRNVAARWDTKEDSCKFMKI